MTDTNNESVSGQSKRKLRKFTLEQRQQIVAESFAVGATVRTVAARYGLRPNQLSAWRSEPKHRASISGKGRFAAVHVVSKSLDGVIEIDLLNSCIRVRGEVSGSMLGEVVGLMR